MMGRLTDDLMAMFGIKPSDRVATGMPRNAQQLQSELADSSKPSTTSETDCISCKVIGTSALVLAGSFVAYNTYRSRLTYKGWRRVMFFGQGVSLTAALLLLAGCRAFNKGIFDRSKPDKTLLDEAKNDVKFMVLSLGYDLPTFLQDNSEPPK
jgi:hypothetical protein